MSTGLRVSDLLARGVRVDWHEGVALVREVVERVLEHAAASPRVPELSDIELSAAGAITLLGGSVQDEPVRRLGQLLQAVLVQSEPPVQLRLVIAQATSPSPPFSSLREYHEAIGYFERPDRAGVLQELFARGTAAAALTPFASSQPPTLDAIAPLPTVQPSKIDNGIKSRAKSRTLWLAGSAAMLALAGLAGVVYARGTGTVNVSESVSAMALEASDAMGSAVVTGVSAVTERVGLGRLVPAEPSNGPAPTVEVASPARVRRAPSVRTTRPAHVAEETPFLAFDLEPVAPFFEMVIVTASPTADSVVWENEATERRIDAPADNIYSAESAGVSPPVGVRPQLPRDLPPGVQYKDLTRIELVISTDGAVESVKLIGNPSVPESMLLSAAKAWQFEPASKDGFPVRYRKSVWITSVQ